MNLAIKNVMLYPARRISASTPKRTESLAATVRLDSMTLAL
jgi:hypothetical protein